MTGLDSIVIVALLVIIIVQNAVKISNLKLIRKELRRIERAEDDIGKYLHADFEVLSSQIRNLKKAVKKDV